MLRDASVTQLRNLIKLTDVKRAIECQCVLELPIRVEFINSIADSHWVLCKALQEGDCVADTLGDKRVLFIFFVDDSTNILKTWRLFVH